VLALLLLLLLLLLLKWLVLIVLLPDMQRLSATAGPAQHLTLNHLKSWLRVKSN